MTIVVNTKGKTISFGSQSASCRIGRAGFTPQDQGREGDAKTPLGSYQIRFGLYRPDRLAPPPSPLPFWPLREDDGWCDDPNDPAYNRFIRRPFTPSEPSRKPLCNTPSHEALWREDGAYDIIIVISHNDSPPVPDRGSAVFIHVAQPDERQTLGCIALAPETMVALLPHLTPGTVIDIRR